MRSGNLLVQAPSYGFMENQAQERALFVLQSLRTSASLAFFYCDFRDDQKRDQRGLLSSLLVQLCEQSNAYSSIFSDFYAAHDLGSRQPSDSALLGCLKDMLMLPGQATVHLIIDALDECPISSGFPSPRERVLKLVEDLVKLQVPNLRICVTSRPEADIVPVLEPLAFRSVSLHDESGHVEDIAEYVRSFVHTSPKMRRWKATDKQLVIEELVKKANGMFRWVFCQLGYLQRCLPGRIRHALNELPETLDDTYARTLEEIDEQNWEYAHRLFQCVAAASRPLLVDELAEFLAFDFEAGSTPTFLSDWRPEDPANAVLSICSSLLAVVKQGDGSPVVQFAHFSVKEYLTSERLSKAKNIISHFHVSMTRAHTIVAQACLGVLLHLDETVTEDSLENFPLAEYAGEHWVRHAQMEDVSSIVLDGMKRLFNPSKIQFSVWVWICDPDLLWLRPQRSERLLKARATPLHYASFLGMHDIVKFLIVEHSQDVNALGFDKKETPLHVASRHGNVDIALLLLEHGANVKVQDDDECTPLLLASQCGHVEVARILLEHGADTEARDYMGRVPLLLGLEYGHVEIVRILLEHGADMEARDKGGWNPLKLARFHECHTVDDHWYTPIHFAQGQEAIRLLLKYGADGTAVNQE